MEYCAHRRTLDAIQGRKASLGHPENQRWRRGPLPRQFRLVVGFWIVSNIISNITWRLPGGAFDFQLDASNYPDLMLVQWMDIVASGLSAISAFALLSIATKIARLQKGFSLNSPSPLKEVFE